jgi:MraZ protein
VALFLNTFVNKVDRKGRVSVPAPFRAGLSGPDGSSALVLYPSFLFSAIEGCTVARMEDMGARHDQLDQFSAEYDNLAAIFSGACQLSLDSEGRIGLPEAMIALAHITENAAFIGQGNTFQIWEPKAGEAHTAAMRERARLNKTTMPGRATVLPPVTP